jgi:hypothetical protein
MKKKLFKLQLSRETLRSLDRDALRPVAGAESEPSNCIGCYPTIWSECISGCLVCPQSAGGTCGGSCNC